MAVLFTTLVSALGGGGGAAAAGAAAGTAAGAAAGTAAGAAATGGAFSSLATIASIGSTVVGGLASIASGKQQEAALKSQAFDEETKAVQETINGRQEALTAMRKLNTDLSNVVVAGYGSGLEATGSIEAAQNEAARVGEANINMARNNASYASAARRGQAQQLRNEGRGARAQGLFGAIQGGLSLFSRRTARG